MKSLKYGAAVILLITMMCFSILLSTNIIKIAPVKAYLTWGGYGAGDGQFNYPTDVCVAGSYVYVLDSDNDRVQQFDTGGNWIRSWGSTGSGDGQFNNPYGICADASGNIWVADTYNNRIQEFNSAGSWLRSYGSYGSGTGNFMGPWDVAADNFGHIYVSDWYNHRIVKLDVSPTGIDWAGSWGSEGTGDYQFNHLAGIACDADGNVFVTDMLNNRVQVFDSAGVFVGKWGSLGSGDGQFGQNSPWGIAVDGAEVYVADVLNSRIEKFYFYIPQNAIGRFNWAFGSAGSGQGQFLTPNGVCVDTAHNIYVADSSNNRIQKFTQYTLTLHSNDPSGLSYNYVNPYEGQGKYPEGSVVTLTAVTNYGYAFTGWNGSYSGMDNPTTITMNGTKEVWANFALPFQASYSTVVPTIDGVIGTEWDDANNYALDLPAISWQIPPPWGPSVQTTAYFKHDGTNIYIGLKVFDIDHTTDEFSVYFDEGDDGAHGSGTRDHVFTSGQEDCKSVFDPYMTGDGYWAGYGFYAPVMGGGDFTAQCAYNYDHWEVEFAIPFVGNDAGTPGTDLSDLVCTVADTVGIKIQYCRWMSSPYAINYFYPPFWQSNVETFTTLSFAPAAPPLPQGLTVDCVVDTAATLTEAWSYSITYADGTPVPGVPDPVTFDANEGGTVTFNTAPFTDGGDFIVTATPKYGYTTGISAQTDGVSSVEIDGLQATVTLVADGAAWVTFTNTQVPSFAAAPTGSLPPGEMTYMPPPLTVVPVQAAWNPDKNNDGYIDLVAGKPTTVLVNLAGVDPGSAPVTVTLVYSGATSGTQTSQPLYKADLDANSIVTFNAPLLSTLGTETISGSYTIGGGAPVALGGIFNGQPYSGPTTCTVRATNDLSLYFGYMHKSAYADPLATPYYDTVTNSKDFITSVYPIKAVSANSPSTTLSKNPSIRGSNSLASDCVAVADLAIKNKKAIGVAVASDEYFDNYFQVPDYAGVSYGPDCKGVIVRQNYWTAAAHEVGHTFNLYCLPTLEEYITSPLYGDLASGVSPATGQTPSKWRMGQDFMGAAPYRTLDNTWVNSATWVNPAGTYPSLFNALTQNLGDPEVVVVSGIFHKDTGELELPLTWSRLEATPSQIVSGDYALRYVDANGNPTGADTKFDVQYGFSSSVAVTVGINRPADEGGLTETNEAPFCFAVEVPAGTAEIRILNPEEELKGTVPVDEIVDASATFGYGYFTDTDYNPIDSFACVFTPSTGSYYKMSATNPGTFCYNLKIANDAPTSVFTAKINIPADFVLKPLIPGTSPVEIRGQPVGYSASGGTITVPNILINQGETITVTVHLDYGLRFQNGGPTTFTSTAQTTFNRGYAFSTTIDQQIQGDPTIVTFQANTANIAAFGKKVTAIGGFLTDTNGNPKGELTVEASRTGWTGTTIATPDGFYFIEVAAGTYTVQVYNSGGTPVATAGGVKVSKDRFVLQNFNTLNPADPAITGFVTDAGGNGVAGVSVQLLDRQGREFAKTTTNLGGYYVFRFYQPGQYTVKITVPPGYTAAVTSTTLNVKQFETAQVNFNLTAKR